MKDQIINDNWMEFMQFYRDVMAEAKAEEIERGVGDMSLGDILMLSTDREKMKKAAVFDEFRVPSEESFWKWYAITKMEPSEAA